MLTDVGDVPVQEIRDCGVDDDRLMNVVGESVKLVMEQVSWYLGIEVSNQISIDTCFAFQ